MAAPTAPIQIPPQRLVEVAKETASGAKMIGALVCCAIVLFVIAGFAMVTEGPNNRRGATHDDGSALIGIVIWLVGLGAVAFHFLRKGKRATEVALRAQENFGHTFFLDGKRILVNDAAGVPQPQLTFKVSGVRRKMLLEMPRATVVS